MGSDSSPVDDVCRKCHTDPWFVCPTEGSEIDRLIRGFIIVPCPKCGKSGVGPIDPRAAVKEACV